MAGGTYNSTNFNFTSTPGSLGIWKVDLTHFNPAKPSSASVTKTASFPDGKFLNGLVTLDKEAGLVLIADSGVGCVWKLNTKNGEVSKPIQDSTMADIPGDIPIGINGIKIRNGDLYFTNYDSSSFFRVPIHPDGTAAGNVTLVAANIAGADDFQFDNRGNVFVAQNRPGSRLAEITSGTGSITVIADIMYATACQFGRTPGDFESLYITSAGNTTMGGRVSRVDVGVCGP